MAVPDGLLPGGVSRYLRYREVDFGQALAFFGDHEKLFLIRIR